MWDGVVSPKFGFWYWEMSAHENSQRMEKPTHTKNLKTKKKRFCEKVWIIFYDN